MVRVSGQLGLHSEALFQTEKGTSEVAQWVKEFVMSLRPMPGTSMTEWENLFLKHPSNLRVSTAARACLPMASSDLTQDKKINKEMM